MTDYLLENHHIKMLVIACNTATAIALEDIQRKTDIPVVGVIQPGARTAIKVTKNQHIGVIGTVNTIKSRAYEQALLGLNAELQVENTACPLLVPFVESGRFLQESAEEAVEASLEPLKGTSIDTLILGCTHYPILKDPIQNYMGEHVKIISSGDETAREVSTILSYKGLLNQSKHAPEHQFLTTGSGTASQKLPKTGSATKSAMSSASPFKSRSENKSKNPLFTAGFFALPGLFPGQGSYTS